ncbi:MAG TPA: AMP-binding protein [Solirubrobacteraceae bacterium]|nr:AMP-binding protein [Solirubrobacteraceae bacterium]
MLASDQLLPQLIARGAREYPDRPYLREIGAGTRTYAEVHEAAMRWAGALRHAGVGSGDHVLVMLPVCGTAVEAWMGIAWLGAVEVPVNISYRGRMLEYIVSDSASVVVVAHARYLDRLEELSPGTLDAVDTLVVHGGAGARPDVPCRVVAVDEFLAEAGTAAEPPAEPGYTDIASIIYTSGTTGASKGVLVPWAQAHATTVGSVPLDDLTGADVYYSPFPLFHISGKFPLYLMALLGSSVVIRDAFDTKAFWEDIERHGCTTTLLLGAMANFIHRQPPRAGERDTPLANVIMVPLIDEVGAFRERFGVRVCTVFNMTEVSSPIASGGWEPANSQTCGRARPGYRCRVADEHDEPLPPGEVGELLIRTEEPWRLMAGYWGKPEQTARAWRNQWLHTGDAFTIDEDGNFYFVDRLKDAIRRRGENVSSMEVEADVNRHPAVLESAAIAVPSDWGEDEVKVVVVLKEGASLAPEELIEFLMERMPHFMVPRYVELAAALPKTETQKIRKEELRVAGITDATWDRVAAGITVRRSA